MVKQTQTTSPEPVIEYCKGSVDGGYIVFGHKGALGTALKKKLETPALRKLLRVGQPYAPAVAACEEVKQAASAVLARGLDRKSAPNTVDAMRMNKAAERKAEKAAVESVAPAKAAKIAKVEARKEQRQAKTAPKGDDTRAIKVLDKKFTYGREGSSRRACWSLAAKGGAVADYIKAGGAAKYLPRWVAAGAIKLT